MDDGGANLTATMTAMGLAAREHVLAAHSLPALERCLRRAMASMPELAP